jgi:hypothetical protein
MQFDVFDRVVQFLEALQYFMFDIFVEQQRDGHPTRPEA